jgi:hypothetical protein
MSTVSALSALGLPEVAGPHLERLAAASARRAAARIEGDLPRTVDGSQRTMEAT